MRNLELPARMSPCLRFFIASLFDEVDGNRCASWVSEARASNALSGAIQRREFSKELAKEPKKHLKSLTTMDPELILERCSGAQIEKQQP
jgi:hypothetical protein